MDAVKILGSLLGGGSMSSKRGGQMMGDLLKNAAGGGGSGGLSDLLGSALGAGASGRGGGLGDIVGAALGGGGRSGGGLGGILGTVAMAALAKYMAGKGGGGGGSMPDLGGLLGGGESASRLDPSALDEVSIDNQAELLIEAMINAAKADGRIDPSEEQVILERLGDLDPDEMAFLRDKLNAPLDATEFARRVPSSMGQQVYGASLLAMELDERSEARYLHELAQALRLDADECNAIHREMGEPEIFR